MVVDLNEFLELKLFFRAMHFNPKIVLDHFFTAPRPILEKLEQHYTDYCDAVPLRIAIGNYNINGGKHFRSIVYKDVSLSDWLLDAHKLTQGSGNIRNCVSPT